MKTRIKIVTSEEKTLYYPQYKYLWRWSGFEDRFGLYEIVCDDIKVAQAVIDKALEKEAAQQERYERNKRHDKTKKTTYVKYP